VKGKVKVKGKGIRKGREGEGKGKGKDRVERGGTRYVCMYFRDVERWRERWTHTERASTRCLYTSFTFSAA
jgi:hypothetical protein